VSVLLLQHDEADARTLASLLENDGFRATAEAQADSLGPIDAAVFDVVVMGVAGTLHDRADLCRRLRSRGYLGAIVALSASATEVPALLDAGADDFAVAPVEGTELAMRIRMAQRRVATGTRARWGRVEIDRVHRSARVHGRELSLTATEYALLTALLDAAGGLVSRADLLAKVWGRDEDPGSNLVEVHLSRLRDKLGTDAEAIETVRRAGYRLKR
jgi:DNA-binding response OmpR family regulator